MAPAAASAPAPAPGVVPALPAAPGGDAFARPLTAAEQGWVDRTLAQLPLRDRVAQLVSVWVLGDYVNAEDPTFVRIRDWIAREHVGGVIMSLGSPLEVAAKVNSMQRLALATPAKVPLLVSSDLEPGLGRFEGGTFLPVNTSWLSAGTATVLPTNMAIGATGRPEDARQAGAIVGREARAAGVHVVYAPVVDVNNNPGNPVINVRSFGEDPAAVARMAAEFVRGLQGEGVAGVAKHFPGHGDTDVDSHNALPVIRSDLARFQSVELVPFRAAAQAGVAGVMSAHIALPAIQGDGTTPATLAPRVMTGLLRDSVGFRGAVFTDAMTMEGVGQGYPIERSCPLAIQAGNDVLLMPSDVTRCVDAVVAAVGRGEIAAERIDASARRVLGLKVRTGAVARPLVDLEALRATVGAPAHWASARLIAQRAVTLLRDSAGLVPATAGSITAVVYAPETEAVAGLSFVAELRAGGRTVRDFRITPRSSVAALDSLAALAAASDRIVVMTYTRTLEGSGRLAIPAHINAWIDRLAGTGKLIVVAGGNPYVIKQFPRVGTYLVTYGRGDALERAAAQAVLGRAPIGGKAPVTLPGFFARGDGLQRGGTP
ncbi:glycoside hydrolase family 3 N-terminal domain-containing protein, partial [Roseisolibacter sp. H3M3-2]|uniref:glycoside hydrolase family 3 protein n=1 Tax=Roseisolibacter sp. H3M3-2 TaxID=3031323 RepID=UPI0023DC4D76